MDWFLYDSKSMGWFLYDSKSMEWFLYDSKSMDWFLFDSKSMDWFLYDSKSMNWFLYDRDLRHERVNRQNLSSGKKHDSFMNSLICNILYDCYNITGVE